MRRVARARTVDANDRSWPAFFRVYTRASVLSTPTYLSASICPETAASLKKRVPVIWLAADTRTSHRAEHRDQKCSAPGWRITAERACFGRDAPTWPNAD